MRRFAVLAILLVVLSTSAAPPSPTMTLAYPTAPARADLDRLNLQMAWNLQLPCDAVHNGIGAIQHIGNQLYIQLRDGTIVAVDAETGKIEWSRRIGNAYPVIRRLGYDADLVLALDVNRLIALDKKSGTQRWILELPDAPVSPPMAGDDLLYVPFTNGRVITYALPETRALALEKTREERKDVAERENKIRQKISAAMPLAPTGVNLLKFNSDASGGRGATTSDSTTRSATTSNSTTRSATTSMAMHKSASYITKQSTASEIKDAAAGPLFLSSRSPGFRVDHPVLVSPLGILLSGNNSTETLTVRRDPENPIYKFNTAAPLALAPAQYGNSAYFACVDGTISAVDLARGKLLWQTAAPSPLADQMIVTETGVFGALRQGGIVMIDSATGNAAWTQSAAQKLIAVNKSYVYANDRIGRMLVLDRTSGAVLAQFDLSKYNVPFVNDRTDRVILAANDGSVICLRDRDQNTPLLHEAPPAPKMADKKAEPGK